MTGITTEDLRDVDFVDAEELAATGLVPFLTGVVVVSTTTGTNVVALSGVDLFRDEERLEAGDTVVLAGTTGADGTYTIDQILTLTTFSVVEAIVSSTGGLLSARHPVGAGKVGFDSTGLTHTSADNVQEAIADLDATASLPAATEEGQILIAADGVVIEAGLPITNDEGYILVNSEGKIIIAG